MSGGLTGAIKDNADNPTAVEQILVVVLRRRANLPSRTSTDASPGCDQSASERREMDTHSRLSGQLHPGHEEFQPICIADANRLYS